MASIRPISDAVTDGQGDPFTAIIVVGAFAQATRGFVPEAGNLWALESFPTTQRATMYAACNVVYQTTATIVVPVSSLASLSRPSAALGFYAGLQMLLGCYTYFLPKETANVALEDS
eukprot:3018256-Prymnesium_polylepis.1